MVLRFEAYGVDKALVVSGLATALWGVVGTTGRKFKTTKKHALSIPL